jgi:hypothetical protein
VGWHERRHLAEQSRIARTRATRKRRERKKTMPVV